MSNAECLTPSVRHMDWIERPFFAIIRLELFLDKNMALIKCPECGHEMSDEALVCPYCGKPNQNRHPSTSSSRQMTVYAISLFLPPFGLWYAWKYLKQKDKKSKRIGSIALVLTIVSTIVTTLMLKEMVDSANKALNSVNFYGL